MPILVRQLRLMGILSEEATLVFFVSLSSKWGPTERENLLLYSILERVSMSMEAHMKTRKIFPFIT